MADQPNSHAARNKSARKDPQQISMEGSATNQHGRIRNKSARMDPQQISTEGSATNQHGRIRNTSARKGRTRERALSRLLSCASTTDIIRDGKKRVLSRRYNTGWQKVKLDFLRCCIRVAAHRQMTEQSCNDDPGRAAIVPRALGPGAREAACYCSRPHWAGSNSAHRPRAAGARGQ